jgi:hypothetical protein
MAAESPTLSRTFKVALRYNTSTISQYLLSSGASSPQQGPSASNPSSPSQLRNRAGAASSSSIFVAGGVCYSFGSLRNDVMTDLVPFYDHHCSSTKQRTCRQRCRLFLLAVARCWSRPERTGRTWVLIHARSRYAWIIP